MLHLRADAIPIDRTPTGALTSISDPTTDNPTTENPCQEASGQPPGADGQVGHLFPE